MRKKKKQLSPWINKSMRGIMKKIKKDAGFPF